MVSNEFKGTNIPSLAHINPTDFAKVGTPRSRIAKFRNVR